MDGYSIHRNGDTIYFATDARRFAREAAKHVGDTTSNITFWFNGRQLTPRSAI